MSGWTPGPWRVSKRIAGLRGIVASLGQTVEDEHFLIRSDHAVPDKHVPRNAALIAAAPRMAEALERIAAIGEQEDFRATATIVDEVVREAREALASTREEGA